MRKFRLTKGLLLIAFLMLSGPFLYTPVVSAVSGDDFKAGNIIDDAVFYNTTSMSYSQIQTFLNAKNPNCDTNGTQPATDWGRPDITHAQLAQYKRTGTGGFSKDTAFHAPPYTCLKDYKQNTPKMKAESELCSALSAKSNRTAARIIVDVADACGINPQVLIILLQKEQSLVTDNWPLNRQYKNATGFACPDTAPCDPAYSGFFYQVYYAARQFKLYKAEHENPNAHGRAGYDYNFRSGRTNRIYWHPDLSRCGYSNVKIKNQATAALYIYTPYRPNRAALGNLYGTGNSCSSYGNRNFWRMFNDWFGSTHTIKYSSLSTPRYMKLSQAMQKVSLRTFEGVGGNLAEDRIIYFNTKVKIDGTTYLRTKHDTLNKKDNGIPLSALEEIDVEFSPMQTPRYMRLSSDLKKNDPRTLKNIGGVLSKGKDVLFNESFTVDGVQYLRTAYDTAQNNALGIPRASLSEIRIEPINTARFFIPTKDMPKKSIKTLEDTSNTVTKGQPLFFADRITINGANYLRTKDDSTGNVLEALPLKDLQEVRVSFSPMSTPRFMRAAEDLYKINPRTLEVASSKLVAGRDILFADSFTFNGIQYLRTEYDAQRKRLIGIPRTSLVEIQPVAMEVPRTMKAKSDLRKKSMLNLKDIGGLIKKNQVMQFETKYIINGVIYLRTEFDTNHDNRRAIPISSLKSL